MIKHSTDVHQIVLECLEEVFELKKVLEFAKIAELLCSEEESELALRCGLLLEVLTSNVQDHLDGLQFQLERANKATIRSS